MSNTCRSARRGSICPHEWIEGFDPTRDGSFDPHRLAQWIKRSQRRISRHNDTHAAHMITMHGFDADALPVGPAPRQPVGLGLAH